MNAPLATVTDYDTLIEALRARKDALGLSDATLDAVAGLATGHTGKLLGPSQVKTLGPVSLGLVLQALGLALIVVEDAEQTEHMRGQYAQRDSGAVRVGNHASPVRSRVVSRVFRHFAPMGGRARWAKVPQKQRAAHGLKMARARWVKPRRRRARPRPVSA